MSIERWSAGTVGRSHTVAYGELVWSVSNARDIEAGFAEQVAQTLARLDEALIQARSDRTRLLSVQVLLADIQTRNTFDAQWCQWIGSDPAAWPQRACYQAALAPGLLVEIVAVAARQ